MSNNRLKYMPVVLAGAMALVIALGGFVASPATLPSASASTPATPNGLAPTIQEDMEYLTEVGFKNPTYTGHALRPEGPYTTYRVQTLNKRTADLMIRTDLSNTREIKLYNAGIEVTSAIDLAYKAQVAVVSSRNSQAKTARPMATGMMGSARTPAQYEALSPFVLETSVGF